MKVILCILCIFRCYTSQTNIDMEQEDPYALTASFIEDIPQWITKLEKALEVDKLDYSLESIKMIDAAMNQEELHKLHNYSHKELNHMFVAYAGEVIIREIGGGKWKLVLTPNKYEDGILMAIIEGNNKKTYYPSYKVGEYLINGGEFNIYHAIKRSVYPINLNGFLEPYPRSFFRRLFNLPPKGLRKAEKELRKKRKTGE